jgi:hypothetical protein
MTGSHDGSDRVAEAIAELYAADPAEFTERRKSLAAAARDAGDRDAAKRITALRKPTRAAWAVNTLARADPGAAQRLAALAAELRDATASKDGRRLRELSGQRGPLIDELTGQALAAAGITDPSAGLRAEVAETLTSALADTGTARQFAAGTLTRAAQWAGFEGAPADEFPESFGASPEPAAGPVPRRPAEAEPAKAEPAKAESAKAKPTKAKPAKAKPAKAEPAEAESAEAESAEAEPAASRTPARTRATPPAPSRAEVPDELAARRRKKYEGAERSVASAADAAAAAVAREEELEAEVRDLEGRLTQARADLADARRRARRAESAEHKARQQLDRTPRS